MSGTKPSVSNQVKTRGKANSSHNDHPPRTSNLTGKKATIKARQSGVSSVKGAPKTKAKASSLYSQKITDGTALINKRKVSYTPANLSQKSYGISNQLLPRHGSHTEHSASGRNHKHA